MQYIDLTGKTQVCIGCYEEKPITEFHSRSSVMDLGSEGVYQLRRVRCRICSNSMARDHRYQSAEAVLSYRLTALKNLCRKTGVAITLPKGYLEWLWEKQNGKCFYTDVDMVFYKEVSPEKVSVDKIVPSAGYVPGNVVLCTQRVNLIKNDMTLEEMSRWTPEWYARVRNFFYEEIPNSGPFPMVLLLPENRGIC